MEWFINLLAEHQLLLLFFVASTGYAIGKISFKGIKLGVAAVLFVGLFISALDKSITLPALVTSLGLVLFVYSVGIASGSSFFASFRKTGLRDSVTVLAMLLLGAGIVFGAYKIINMSPAVAAGLFTGSFTNTPALAAVVQMLSSGQLGDTKELSGLPTVGYSIAYPMGVLGPILAIAFWQKRFKINYKNDAKKAKDIVAAGSDISNESVKITNEEFCGKKLGMLLEKYDWPIIFGRLQRGKQIMLITDPNTKFEKNDIVSIIGAPEDIQPAISLLGVISSVKLDLDRTKYDYRRVFVSNKDLVGKSIKELRIPQKYGAMVTRVRRGDIEMLAHKDFVLEYGDRVRFISQKKDVSTVSKYFGDSYKSVSDFHIFSIGMGLCLGLLLGMIPIKLPGGLVFRLGDAGGVLIMGLILSALRRTGPIVWGISYTANLTLREFGLILMLAGIGVRSGQTFVEAIGNGNGVQLFIAGAIASIAVPMLFIPLAFKKFKLPFAVVSGMVSALHTQPAVHAYASNQAENDLPNHGYAMVFPVATIGKILIAQLMIMFLI